MSQPFFRDVELLSAYLDKQLSQADSTRLEIRIKSEPQLRVVYDDLRAARNLLGSLPARRAPRNFVLTPKMAGIKPPIPAAFPFFRLASVFAVVLLFAGYAVDLSEPVTAGLRAQAPALAYGAAAPNNASSVQASPLAGQAADTLVPTPSTEFSAPSSSAAASGAAASSLPTPEFKRTGPAINRSTLQQSEQEQPLRLPVASFWLSALLVLAVLSGSGALLLRTRAENAWRRANALKPAALSPRDWQLICLAALLVLLMAAGIYWLSTTPLLAPFPQP